MKTKICGICDPSTLKYITNHPYPPDYIGFIVNYKKSKRFVEFNDLKKLVEINRKKSKYVAVLVKPTDMELKKIVLKALKNNYQILVTADHGNAEVMINKDGSPHTYHTTNLVPLILISNNIEKSLKDGKLGDIAPTVLELMNIEKPVEMTGNSLLN